MKKVYFLLLFPFLLSFFGPFVFAQADSAKVKVKEKIKKGWTWAALPVVAYDADMGVQLGALGQVFYYGDGSTYPEYKHTVYAECSWFTKGSAVYQVFYDSKYLIPAGYGLPPTSITCLNGPLTFTASTGTRPITGITDAAGL